MPEAAAQFTIEGLFVNQNALASQVERFTRGLESRSKINFSVNEKSFTDPLGHISRSANEFTRSLDASNARVIAFGASVGLIYAFQRAMQDTVKSAIEVEKALTDINVVLGLSSSNLNKFSDGLFTVAKQTGQSFAEIAKGATELSRQGLGVEETLVRIKDAAILSRLTGLELGESITDLTAILNSFSSTAITSTEVVAKLAKVDASFAINASQLAEGIKRVGSTAEQAGISIDELNGLLTAIQVTTGRGGAVGGNALKNIIPRLENADTIQKLRELGVEINSYQSGLEKLQAVANKVKTSSPVEATQIKTLVGGRFQYNIVSAAVEDLGKKYSITARATQESSSATNEAIIRNEELNKTTAAVLNATSNNLKQYAAKVGDLTLVPTIKSGAQTLNDVFDSLKGNSPAAELGKFLGKGILEGIGDFISGPGLVLGGAILGKLLFRLGGFSIDAVKNLIGSNTAGTEQGVIQQNIGKSLLQNVQITGGLVDKNLQLLDTERNILKTINQQGEARAKSVGQQSNSGGGYLLAALEREAITQQRISKEKEKAQKLEPTKTVDNFFSSRISRAGVSEIANIAPLVAPLGSIYPLRPFRAPGAIPSALDIALGRTSSALSPSSSGNEIPSQLDIALRKSSSYSFQPVLDLRLAQARESATLLGYRSRQEPAEGSIKGGAFNYFQSESAKAKALEKQAAIEERILQLDIDTLKLKEEEISYQKAKIQGIISQGEVQRTQSILARAPAVAKFQEGQRYRQIFQEQNIAQLEGEASKVFGGSGARSELEGLSQGNSGLSLLALGTLNKAKATRQATFRNGLQNYGFAASIGVPILANLVGDALSSGENTLGDRRTKLVTGGIADTASFAGIGALFGPYGVAAGLAVGGIIGLTKALSGFNDILPDLQKNVEKTNEKINKSQDAYSRFVQAQEQLKEAQASNASPIVIRKIQANLEKARNETGYGSSLSQAILSGNQDEFVVKKNTEQANEKSLSDAKRNIESFRQTISKLIGKQYLEEDKSSPYEKSIETGGYGGTYSAGLSKTEKITAYKQKFNKEGKDLFEGPIANLFNIRSPETNYGLEEYLQDSLVTQQKLKDAKNPTEIFKTLKEFSQHTGLKGVDGLIDQFKTYDKDGQNAIYRFLQDLIADEPRRLKERLENEAFDKTKTLSIPRVTDDTLKIFNEYRQKNSKFKLDSLNRSLGREGLETLTGDFNKQSIELNAPFESPSVTENRKGAEAIRHINESGANQIAKLTSEFQSTTADKILTEYQSFTAKKIESIAKNTLDEKDRKDKVYDTKQFAIKANPFTTASELSPESLEVERQKLSERVATGRAGLLNETAVGESRKNLELEVEFNEKLLELATKELDELKQKSAVINQSTHDLREQAKIATNTTQELIKINTTVNYGGGISALLGQSVIPTVDKANQLRELGVNSVQKGQGAQELGRVIESLGGAISDQLRGEIVDGLIEQIKEISPGISNEEARRIASTQVATSFAKGQGKDTTPIIQTESATKDINSRAYLDTLSKLRGSNARTDDDLLTKRTQGLIFSSDFLSQRTGVRNNQILSGDFKPKSQLPEALREGFDYNQKDAFKDLQEGAAKVGDELKSSFKSAFVEFEKGTKSATEALRDLGISFATKVQDKILDVGLGQLFNGIFGGGGGGNLLSSIGGLFKANGGVVRRFSSGGGVTGGSGMRDDVPALLGEGEYVVKRSAVQKYGSGFLNHLNSGGLAMYDSGGSVNVSLRNSYAYNNRSFPTGGSFDIDSNLSTIGQTDTNNPRNAVKFERQRALQDYLKGKYDYDTQKAYANKVFRYQQKAQTESSYIGAGISLAGALAGAGHGSSIGETNIGGGAEGEDLGGGYAAPLHATGGLIRKFTKGGSTDNVPALLTGGEFVLNRQAVTKHGVSFLDKLNNGQVRGFAAGGLVGLDAVNSPTVQGLSGDGSQKITDALTKLTPILEQIRDNTKTQNGQSKTNPQNQTGTITIAPQISVTIQGNGAVSSDSSSKGDNNSNQLNASQGTQLAQAIKDTVIKTITEQQRPGGILANTKP